MGQKHSLAYHVLTPRQNHADADDREEELHVGQK